MEANNFTREQLAQYILHTAKDSFIDKIKEMVVKEAIITHTTKGKALTKKEYLEEVMQGKKAIEKGNYKTSNELRKIVASWDK